MTATPTAAARARPPSLLPRGTSGILGGAILLFAAAACDSGPSAEQHLERARDFLAARDHRSSVIELKNALQKNPDMAEARWLLGQVYLELGAGAEAEKEIGAARALGLKNPDLEVAHARALLLQGEFEKALRAVEAQTVDETTAAWEVLRGEAQLGLGNTDASAAAFRSALEKDQGNAEAQRGLARVGLVSGDTAGASEQIDKAIEKSDTDSPTWMLKGELELSQGKFVDAQASFERALELVPSSSGSRIGIARALLGQEKPDEAAKQIDALAEVNADDPLVHYLRALVARQKNDLDATQLELREVLSKAPNHVPSLLMMGQVQYLKREFQQAAENLERYLSAVPDNAAARKLLGAVQIELGQPDRAIVTLQPLEARMPEDPQLLAMLGTAYMGQRDFVAGKRYLDKASKLAPDAAPIRTQLAVSRLATGDSGGAVSELEAAVASDPGFARADFLLILTHLQQRDFDKGLAAARSLLAKQPENPEAHNLVGAALEAKGDLAGARESYRNAVATQPGYRTAALNLARLDLADGNTESARKGYEAVLEQHANDAVALVALARLASDEGRPSDGLEMLERARTNNPRALQPRLVLSAYYLRQARRAEALTIAREAAEVAPNHPAVLLALGRAQLGNGLADEAVETLERLSAQAPDNAEIHYQLAGAHARRQDLDKARASLDRALAADPKHLAARLTLGNLALRTGRIEEALATAALLERDHPDSAAGQILRGDIEMTRGDHAAAVSAYGQALERGPSTGAAVKLQGAQRRGGDSAGAYRTLSKWLVDHPEDATARLVLASALHQDGRTPEARAAYERVLETQPENVLALNNLSWLLHEAGDPRALEFAERAYRQVPEQPEIADTYGWLLLKSGQTEQALALLAKAAEAAPGNGDIRYHHAAALAQADDKARARDMLESLLSNETAFPERAAAQALLDELR